MKAEHNATPQKTRPRSARSWSALAALAAGGLGLAAPDPKSPENKPIEPPLDHRHVQASLHASSSRVTPGQGIELGLEFKIEKGWHVYWDGLNDTGFPPQVEFESLPEGWEAPQAIRWMAPKRHVGAGGILDHIYEDRLVLLMPMSVPANAKPGRVTLRAKADWLVCQESCIPEEAPVELTLDVASAGTADAEPAVPEPIAWARARLPRPWKDAAALGASARADGARATIEFPGAASLAFFPGAECEGLADLVAAGRRPGARLTLAFEDAEESGEASLEGILEVTSPSGAVSWYEVKTQRPQRNAGGDR